MNRKLELFLTFSQISAFCFGGGYAMLPFFQRELVQKRGWISQEEMGDIFAIAQCTPGVIAVNTATFCGYKVNRLTGALFATLGVLFPPILIIGSIAAFFSHFSEIIWIQYALAGVRAGVCALILKSVIQLFRTAVIDLPTAFIFCTTLLVSSLFGLSPILLVTAAGLLGLAISKWKGVKRK